MRKTVEGECVLWDGAVTKQGYGYFYRPGNRRVVAHRDAWEREHGPLDSNLQLHHWCEVKRCINTAHLEPLTRVEHQRVHKMRPSHCRHGHEYTAENTRVRKSGYICCRTCERLRQRPGGLEMNL